ncbi:IS1595 family transposase [Thioclava nitratireducens]|uniref:IS1595 family transposase n=1 Tax=Thioclava nitratireducens TaxID=1915078 RepID=UPI00247FF23E|nr:IS1595 family transposase [Thioclava nitratireducens]WGT51395.1 IS1595 family transposase [Thioclava nitratireducens]
MRHQDFRHFLDALNELNPGQIEDAQTRIRDLRRKTEAISEIEARTSREAKCQFCGEERRQKWGRTRTKIQRYRCGGCQKTFSGRTGSVIGRIHRPDLFMVALRDMLLSPTPLSVRKLAKKLGLNKYTVWRWRMLVFSIIENGVTPAFAGIIEADETYQRESRKGSREWVRHAADPLNIPAPPRPRWEDFTTQGLKRMRGLSRWQLPILTVADRGGAKLFQRLANHASATLQDAMTPLVPKDAVLCTDGANGYSKIASAGGIEHVVLSSKPGTRVAADCYHIQNVNSLHARYKRFIKPFCGPASKHLNGYIRWLELRLAGARPAEVMRASWKEVDVVGLSALSQTNLLRTESNLL